MATNTTTTEETEKPKTAAKATDFIEKIGRNFNPKNAEEIFGAKATEALNAVAKAGGYGVFNENDHYNNSLFGGFAIPQGDEHAETRDKINAALNAVK